MQNKLLYADNDITSTIFQMGVFYFSTTYVHLLYIRVSEYPTSNKAVKMQPGDASVTFNIAILRMFIQKQVQWCTFQINAHRIEFTPHVIMAFHL